jgi:hypothetical protein
MEETHLVYKLEGALKEIACSKVEPEIKKRPEFPFGPFVENSDGRRIVARHSDSKYSAGVSLMRNTPC